MPDTLDVGEVKAVTEEDMTPLGVDDGAFNACVTLPLFILPAYLFNKLQLPS